MKEIRFEPLVDGVFNALDASPTFNNPAGSIGAVTAGGQVVFTPGTFLEVREYGYGKEYDETLLIDPVVRYYIRFVYRGKTYHLAGQTGETGGPLSVGRYTNSTFLYRMFGEGNVTDWANFGATSVATAAARIDEAVNYADNYVDTYLSGGVVKVPFTDPIPDVVSDAATIIAGVRLYEARGSLTADSDATEAPTHIYTAARKKAGRILSGIRAGRLRAGRIIAKTYPVAGE
jgi:hypothetical protein